MELESDKDPQEKICWITRRWKQMKEVAISFNGKVKAIISDMIKVGRDDPRRVAHSVKMGISLTLVSLLYYSTPLYDGFGVTGMWAVLTVVVVFEFTVGGTLSKCLNRGLATMVAGALGVGSQHFAGLFGETGEPIVIGILVFLLATGSTFMRFLPKIKARYDYGVMIFILTFSLVSISGYRVEDLIDVAHHRISTIVLGGAICVIVSICICPVWAGGELHDFVASNIEKLASSLQGCENQSLNKSQEGCGSDEYKSVLASKFTEESMANLSRWEPRHGNFSRSHPWPQYLNIGSLSRQCAYQIEALNCYASSNLKACPSEFQTTVQESRKVMCEEASKALTALAISMRTMTKPTCACTHVDNSKHAMNGLRMALENYPIQQADLLSIIPPSIVVSMLMEIVLCVEKLYGSIYELSDMAHFKDPGPTQKLKKSQKIPVINEDSRDHVIIVDNRAAHKDTCQGNVVSIVQT